MQYKLLFFSSAFALSAFTASAQKEIKGLSMQGATKVIKTDTIVIRPAKPSAKLAVNTPVKPTYKNVPLADEKAYYGTQSDYVATYVRKYLNNHNRTLNVVQQRGEKYFPIIDNILAKYEIPKELKYLSVIESALNNTAVSRVGAVGPWQFMSGTARFMGLTVNGRRDDRRDWHKSTHAAAKYLAYLYEDLQDWLLVVAAYNSGPVPVKRAIARTGSNNFWDIKKYLPRETQGHVLAFIATATIFENLNTFIGENDIPEDLAMSKYQPKPAAAPKKPRFSDEELKNMVIVRISEPMYIDLMAMELGVEKNLLEKWNEDYDLFVFDTYESEFYNLRIPKDKLETFIQKKDQLTSKSRKIFSEMLM